MAITWVKQNLGTGDWYTTMNRAGTVFFAADYNTGDDGLGAWLKLGSKAWTRVDTGLTPSDWCCVGCDGTGQNLILGGDERIYISHNYGVSWTELTLSTSPDYPIYHTAVMSTDGQYIIVLTDEDDFGFVSSDGGYNWGQVPEDGGWLPELWREYSDMGAAMNSTGETQICLGTIVQVSHDYGSTWHLTAGVPNFSYWWFSADGSGFSYGWSAPLAGEDNQTLYAIGNIGYPILWSPDRGATWTELCELVDIPAFDRSCNSINLSASNNFEIMISTMDRSTTALVSEDGGYTWTGTTPNNVTGYGGNSIAINLAGTRLLWGFSYGNVYIGYIGEIKAISTVLLEGIGKVSGVAIDDIGSVLQATK